MSYLQESIALSSGEMFHYDFRPSSLKSMVYPITPPDTPKPLRAVQWNIERGYKLSAIIDQLRLLDADIIALQEVDVGCKRSDYIDTGVAIAKTLGLNYLYQSEFIELTETPAQDHPLDEFTPQTEQYSQYRVKSTHHGNHGHAILTKFDFVEWSSVDHAHQGYNWERDGALLGEPRKGKRQTLCAFIMVPHHYSYNPSTGVIHTGRHGILTTTASNSTVNHAKDTHSAHLEVIDESEEEDGEEMGEREPKDGDEGLSGGDAPSSQPIKRDDCHGFIITVYTAHFELFCGMIDRLKTFSEILYHHKQTVLSIAAFNKSNPDTPMPFYGSMIMGDFNTLAHSIARFSKKYCKDQLRWGSLGYTEAEFWYAYVLDYEQDTPSSRAPSSSSSPPLSTSSSSQPPSYNTRLARLNLGLNIQHLMNLVNPGFQDPFPANTETLTNYSGWFHGKLDWTLCRNFSVVRCDLHNTKYTASDHRLLLVEGFFSACEMPHHLLEAPPGDHSANSIHNTESNSNLVKLKYQIRSNSNIIKTKPPLADDTAGQEGPLVKQRFNAPQRPEQQQGRTNTATDSETKGVNGVHECHHHPAAQSNSVSVDGWGEYDVVPCRIHGYYRHSRGVRGLLQRVVTPFTKQVIMFVLGVLLSFIIMSYISPKRHLHLDDVNDP